MKQIKKEIVISATAAKVWEHITDPKRIAGWLMENDFEATVGKEFSMNCNTEGEIACVVKEIVPERKLVYSFRSEDIPVETLVTITLAKEGDRTRLTLVHSGWDTLPPDQQGIADTYDGGWAGFLEKLQELLSPMKTN
jgi:uncharacterized protein YndB with AHSA1/START domain